MLFLEMQKQFAQSWLQLAEDSTRALTDVCVSTSREALNAVPSPAQPIRPKAVERVPAPATSVGMPSFGFGAMNPFTALAPFFAPSQPAHSSWPSFAQPKPIWPFSASFPGLPGSMPSMFGNPWMPGAPPVASWFTTMFSGSPWGHNPWMSANPWAANPWTTLPSMGQAWMPQAWMPQSGLANPWMNLWQVPKFDLMSFGMQRPSAIAPATAMADAWMSSYRTATGHAAAAILAPLQVEKKPELAPQLWWMWPMASSNKAH